MVSPADPPDASAARHRERAFLWQRRVTVAGMGVSAVLLGSIAVWGGVLTWQVAQAFRTGGEVVQWRDGPDLVVMLAPLLAALAGRAWRRWGLAHPLLGIVAFGAVTVLAGVALGRADAALLEHVAATHGYHHCRFLDVWDAHGNRGGGPALKSWGYSRAACPGVP